MSELALRGYNVAMPEMDVGDDFFAVNDQTGALWRIQVKTARPRVQKKGMAYQFRVRESAIQTTQTPDLHFVFVLRALDRWHFAIMSRSVLHSYVISNNLGTLSHGYRQINLFHAPGVLRSGPKIALSHLLDQWSPWPPL